MVDRSGCTCDVYIERHIVTTELLIEKYKNISGAAPENNLCGLSIDIEMLNDESVSNPIECTNGVDRRQFSLVKNGALRFTSRIVQGNFTRGYCIIINRDKITNNISQRLKIVCNESEILQYDTSSINPTDINPETNDSSDTMFISIGASVGSLFIIIVGIIGILIRRQGCKIKKPMSTANLNMQYDNLSESRNTSSYSTLDRPTTDDHPYDVVL
ncbi:uncharacterized protein LOC143049401 [Mytilus galloprovincialis]|uniref:uncharacterized protein LOC143049401 n=1 Tax=Mytilus galloprovincialis TaxID=29158 RepID=UPI003F7C3F87